MPSWEIEDCFNHLVCGIDEAGRGPWVGPVVAAAVMFLNRHIEQKLLAEINDSKKISASKREKIYESLLSEADKGNITYGIGLASAAEIDKINILQATFLAMSRAVEKLSLQPQTALIDGNRLPQTFPCHTTCIIGGDAKSYSIAAASILAKVYRDRYMRELAQKYPAYGFEKNAGYGTAKHLEAIQKYGLIPEHRLSYKPIRAFLEKDEN